MKNVSILVVLLLLCPPIAYAQDDGGCTSAQLNARINVLIADFQASQDNDAESASSLEAIQSLQTDIEALVTECEGEVVEEPMDEMDTPTEISDISGIMPGRYQLTWSFPEQRCPPPNEDVTLSGSNRPVMVSVDVENNRILLDDLFVFGDAGFEMTTDNTYQYLRNQEVVRGFPYSYNYAISSFSAEQISGTVTNFFSWNTCVLEGPFEMVRAEDGSQCMVGSDSGANLRSGPGTGFSRMGALNAREAVDAIGQATGGEGFVWWQLDNDLGWIRSDVVREAGDCDSLPVVSS